MDLMELMEYRKGYFTYEQAIELVRDLGTRKASKEITRIIELEKAKAASIKIDRLIRTANRFGVKK